MTRDIARTSAVEWAKLRFDRLLGRARPQPLRVFASTGEDASTETDRRARLVQQLYRTHANETAGAGGELIYRNTLPPVEWINDRLTRLGERWRVERAEGAVLETQELR